MFFAICDAFHTISYQLHSGTTFSLINVRNNRRMACIEVTGWGRTCICPLVAVCGWEREEWVGDLYASPSSSHRLGHKIAVVMALLSRPFSSETLEWMTNSPHSWMKRLHLLLWAGLKWPKLCSGRRRGYLKLINSSNHCKRDGMKGWTRI